MIKKFTLFFLLLTTLSFAQVNLQEMRDFKFAYSLFEDGHFSV